MSSLEEKIRAKAKNCLEGWKGRGGKYSGVDNDETYLNDIVGSMLRIIKAEVNIRLQEARRKGRER